MSHIKLAFAVLFLLIGLAPGLSLAAEPPATDPAAQDRIRNSLKLLLPDLKPDQIQATAVPGLYEIVFGHRLVYMTDDGRFLMQGTIIDLETRENITDARTEALLEQSRREGIAAIEKMGEDKMIIFGPEDAKYTLTVFTDLDCGWCRRLHSEIGDYAKAGIRVRYLFYPRAGVGSDSYKKAVSVWCSDDRKKSLTEAKAGNDPEPRKCENPVNEHMAIAAIMGVEGTPAMFYGDTQVGGYHPAKRIRQALDQASQAKAKANKQASIAR